MIDETELNFYKNSDRKSIFQTFILVSYQDSDRMLIRSGSAEKG